MGETSTSDDAGRALPGVVAVLLNDRLLGESLARSLADELRSRGRSEITVVDADTADGETTQGVRLVVTDHVSAASAELLRETFGGVPLVAVTDSDAGSLPSTGGPDWSAVSPLAGVVGIADAVCLRLPPAGGHPAPSAAVSDSEFRRNTDRLTPRKREVMMLLASGHSVEAIARRLQLSRRTVANNRYDVLRELGVATNAELMRLAIRCGYVRA